ncbi:MAG: hypothetical protein K6A63_07050 [Acholeplasmatales bacterium]|nr:hypothetical protein [Acholeplasmatales bacterium]
MDFQIFFLKENSRIYDTAELMTFLSSNSNITPPNAGDGIGKREYIYYHQTLNFEAKFIINNKSVVPHLERLGAKYFDVNFYVTFNLLLSNYAAETILDIVQEICSKFDFKVYIESYGTEVRPFRRVDVIQQFNLWKKAFADKYPEQLLGFYKLDASALQSVYTYLLQRKRLELTYDQNKLQVSNYYFLHAVKSRSAFVAIKWNGDKPFILPPAVDVLIYDDGRSERYLPMVEVLNKAGKYFSVLDNYGSLQILESKYVSKFAKVLNKEKFAPSKAELLFVPLDKLLDV